MSGRILDRIRPRLAATAIVALGLLVITGVVASILLLTGDLDKGDNPASPSADPGSPIAASPPASATPVATPDQDEPAYPAGSLPAMLDMAPDQIDDDETGLPTEATWADIETWFELVNIDPATADMADIERAVSTLELPGVLQTRAVSEDWRDIYGFNVRDLHQVLTIGHAPDQVVIMRGDFSPKSLYDTWVRNGYFAVEVEETTIWSLFPGDRIDLTAPASRPALGLFNNLVVIDNNTIVASARQSDMAGVLRVLNGDDASLLEHGRIEQAIATWAPTGYPVSAILADGTLLEVPASTTSGSRKLPLGTAVATPLAQAPLPQVSMVVLGVMPSNDDPANTILQAIMMYDDAPDDLDHLPSILEAKGVDEEWAAHYRLEFARLVGENSNMIQVAISRVDSSVTWSQVIEDRDLGPLHWSAGA